MRHTTNNAKGIKMEATDAIARQKTEWAAKSAWEADMAAKRAARLANRGAGRVATGGWGTTGVRYDEACERCGRVDEVDNTTGLCRSCR